MCVSPFMTGVRTHKLQSYESGETKKKKRAVYRKELESNKVGHWALAIGHWALGAGHCDGRSK